MNGKNNPASETTGIGISDVCGLWEVIRIYQDNGQWVSYPWIKDRYKFNFLPEMIFLRLKDGHNSHGTWELVERAHESFRQHVIILDATIEFAITSINEEEMILSRGKFSYFLVRRL